MDWKASVAEAKQKIKEEQKRYYESMNVIVDGITKAKKYQHATRRK